MSEEKKQAEKPAERPIETPVSQEKLQPIQPQGGSLPASVFKNEGRDVSGEALARNELGKFNRIPDEPVQQEAVVAEPVSEPEPAAEPEPEPEPEPKKLWANKYTSPEELEKGYLESQKGFMSKVESEVQKRLKTETEKVKEAVDAEHKTSIDAAQAIQQKPLGQMTPDEHIELFTRDPVAYNQLQQQELLRNIRASQIQEQWRRDNQDLLKMEVIPGEKPVNGEFLVSAFSLHLAKENPELLSDGTGERLLTEATGRVRNLLAIQQNQGKQEAMVLRETTRPLQAAAAPAATGDNRQKTAAPAKAVDPLEDELARQRKEQKRISPHREVVRY